MGDGQEEMKYLVRDKNLYSIKPKFQEDWINRLRHVKHVSRNIGCIYVGNERCILSRREEHWFNTCPCLECGGQWEANNNNNSSKLTDNKTI